MDPLGLAKDIFGLTAAVYWGLALTLLGVAILKPRRWAAKVGWASAVVAVFTAPILIGGNESRRINSAFKDSCNKVQESIKPVQADSNQFVDNELVWLGRKSPAYEGDFIRYMLERQLATLEVSYDPQFWSRLNKAANQVRGGTVVKDVFVRLSLESRGHPNCSGFEAWASEYPSQTFPWMQMLGLRSGQCVGFELVSAIKSRYGMFVERQIVERNGNNGALEVHRYRLHDSTLARDVGTATLAVSSVYSHRDVLCGSDAIAAKLQSSIQSRPDPRYAQVSEVELPELDFPNVRPLSLKELMARRPHLARDISIDRSVWYAPRYQRKLNPDGSVDHVTLTKYELISLVDDRAHHIPLNPSHSPGKGPDAVGANGDVIAVLIRSGYKSGDDGVLLEFTRRGKPLRQQSLTAEEMQSLLLR